MFKNKKGQVRAGWFIVPAFIAMVVAQQIFALPGLLLLIFIETPQLAGTSQVHVLEMLDNHPWFFLAMQGGGILGSILITYIFWRFINKGTWKTLGFKSSIPDFLYGLFLGAVSICIIFIILLSSGNVTLLNSWGSPEFSTYTVSFLILFILVGFSEEIFFRGYVMSTMASRNHPKWAIYVVSAVIFSIAHGMNPNVSLLGLLNILMVGLLFAYMFDATKSLWLPIGYHMTWNYFQGNVFGFAVSGTTPHGIYNVSVDAGNEWLTGGAFGLEGGLLATLLIILGFFATRLYVQWKQ
ncbi:CPBP family intramembrane glutamic endopeptidase [Sporosarcina sp. Te-1]|uniref:CPBP family intramembrane glutamic endopeptidase n=1 Tax=Sporosarcina sp. Te-1 TaxID=2818390 RepID=UPI001A9CD9BC|nr:CPBP family intramembrane glutamic endopeptidase [Sporosarcina sp. Te-1]QTD40422.1 CPBP family intramembrane metalloprotease [Sporosarcina sp. Te-1]